MPSVHEALHAVCNAATTVFWTAFYFVYFLFKGKREWKCEKSKGQPAIQLCCMNGESCTSSSSSSAFPTPSHHHQHDNNDESLRHRKPLRLDGDSIANHNTTPKSFYASNSGLRGFLRSTWQTVKNGVRRGWQFAKRVGAKIWRATKRVLVFVWSLICCIFAVIRAFLFPQNVPTQTLPSTPKPYSVKPASPTYNKVAFQFEPIQDNDDVAEEVNKGPQEEEETIYEDIPKKIVPDSSESFYSQRVYEEPEVPREKSVPPPPPPPPPPKPVSREASHARSTTPGRALTPGRERREVKGGIGGFKPDIMDELEEQQRMRQERASMQREMTQSCHPDMAQWKANEAVDRASANSTPWRASSVGPTMRKLEQVVSRIDGEEPTFAFRPKIVHSSEEYQSKNRAYAQSNANGNSSDFMMGRSVFSPVEEAERMRQDINSKTHQYGQQQQQQPSYSSSGGGAYQNGNRMEDQRSRSVHRNDQVHDYQSVRNPFGSAAYKSSPYASHTARRSKTPVRFGGGGGEQESAVDTVARNWPPVSNASGAMTNARDEWVGKSMLGDEHQQVGDDGLVMTMCRRVVERKRDENWKWRDENGRLLDEKNQNSWKGELDTLLRDGPNEGRHWSRTVEKLPTGDTRFQDVNRQYNKEFVVESVVRNY